MDSINPFLVVAAGIALLALVLVWSPLTTFSPSFSTPRTDVTLAIDQRYREPIPSGLVLNPYVAGHDVRPRNPYMPEQITRGSQSGLYTNVALPPPPPITLPEPPVMLGPGMVEVK